MFLAVWAAAMSHLATQQPGLQAATAGPMGLAGPLTSAAPLTYSIRVLLLYFAALLAQCTTLSAASRCACGPGTSPRGWSQQGRWANPGSDKLEGCHGSATLRCAACQPGAEGVLPQPKVAALQGVRTGAGDPGRFCGGGRGRAEATREVKEGFWRERATCQTRACKLATCAALTSSLALRLEAALKAGVICW